MTLPFELYKGHKTRTKYYWKKRGLITDNFDEIYNRYIHSSKCERCETSYKNRTDRCMDHCHLTGEFRNILCHKCNTTEKQIWNNTTGEQYIYKTKNKNYKTGYCFRILIERNGKYLLAKKRTTLEKAIDIRDKFILDNPGYFLNHS